MPTPVNVARQCLTPDAAHALDEAVAVARKRGHAQTTSLHAVSALLSISSSALRDACARARNSAYSHRLQFKALELCLSVSLDRVPSSQLSDDPPVSNSLMAAIKRSQANQRRQPENFHLYHQMTQQQQNTVSCIKVEMRHLILSILDDPVVSRLFGEAGYRSTEIKLAIVRPLPQLIRYPRLKGPPLFLCNITDNREPGLIPGRGGFNFPFPASVSFFHEDDNNRRIGEVLARVKGRNPLLMGICAYDTLKGFVECVEKIRQDVLPKEIHGLNMITIQNDISKHILDSFDKESLEMKFKEISRIIDEQGGPGLVVNYGDLKVFLKNPNDRSDTNDNGGSSNAASYIIAQLTKLMEIHGSKIWLMGSVPSYEVYLKFVSMFPSVEKDWDLQILPITSVRPSLAESYHRPSLMESFVPFGGFFSTPSEVKEQYNGVGAYQRGPRCHLCNERCEQEIVSVSKGGLTASAADQYQSSLPPWLQMAEHGTNKVLDDKIKDDSLLLREKVTGVQKKWDSICQRLHHSQSLPELNTYKMGMQFPPVVSSRFVDHEKAPVEKCGSNDTIPAPKENSHTNGNYLLPNDFHKMPTSKPDFPVVPVAKNISSLTEIWKSPSKPEDHDSSGRLRSPCSFSNSSGDEGCCQTSPTAATSVTTDLGLGVCSVPTGAERNNHLIQKGKVTPKDFSGCFSAKSGDFVNGSISYHQPQSSSSSCPDIHGQLDPNNFKMLYGALTEKITWQDHAVRVISETIVLSRTRCDKLHGASMRGNIWFNFTGPDRFGKKKVAVALADVVYGSVENLISVDLGSQDEAFNGYEFSNHTETIDYELRYRGKNIVDYIAGELCRKPLSVVFLEHVNKADPLVQNSLSQAIRTGKFPDSHGREVTINNTIFVITSTHDNHNVFPQMDSSNYSEENFCKTKCHPFRILIANTFEEKASAIVNSSPKTRNHNSSSSFVNKRKLNGTNVVSERSARITEITAKRPHRKLSRSLDLNLPAEDNEVRDTDDGGDYENSIDWLENLFKQVHANVVFKAFDFDALAKKWMNVITEQFHKFVNSKCLLDIDSKVMEQVLGAAYTSNTVEDWVEHVLVTSFKEIPKRYNLTSCSIVKLVACEGLFLDEKLPRALLPSRIIMN